MFLSPLSEGPRTSYGLSIRQLDLIWYRHDASSIPVIVSRYIVSLKNSGSLDIHPSVVQTSLSTADTSRFDFIGIPFHLNNNFAIQPFILSQTGFSERNTTDACI